MIRVPINSSGTLDLKSCLIKVKKLGLSRIFLESGLKLTTSFMKEKLIDDFKIFISDKKCGKNGINSFKNHFKSLTRNQISKIEKINLFDDKLISFKLR